MSFYDYYQGLKDLNWEELWAGITAGDVERALAREALTERDYLALLSPAARSFLEPMAQRARRLSIQHFGRVIVLYTPLYLSNYCVNRCLYCGLSASNQIARKTLTPEEIEAEGRAIAGTGLRHLLLLTGEARRHAPLGYLVEAVKLLRPYFSSLSIEVYPLETEEYRTLLREGVDGLTVYQEVYDEEVYAQVHPAGPKRDYRFRLEAPERACQAGMVSVNIGALLGLNDWRREAFVTGLHAAYLQDHYWATEVAVSFPRLRPHAGSSFVPTVEVTDADLVQMMLALRLYRPRLGITISTRERPELRDRLVMLGVTRLSAGSSTEVGGRTTADKGEAQFEVADRRTVAEIYQMVLRQGYQPVFKDWEPLAG
ncbi:MAG: 2-iminoacetate synthase ThiH [Clostridia bacterium]|nr:MAG: 2-iminoacetate synthase ThiH [Clostridia bacterium]